jgi:hypothetical protein
LLAGLLTAAGNRWWVRKDFGANKVLPPASEEYQRIISRNKGADSALEIVGTIRVYDMEDKGSLKETSTFRCVRSGKQFYTQLSYVQTFCNGTIVLQLDTVNKRIMLSAADPHATPENFMPAGQIGLLFSDTAQFRISGAVTENGSERSLTLKSDFNPGVRSSTLIYDTLTYRVRQARIEWWKSLPGVEEPSNAKMWRTTIDFQYHPAQHLDMDKKIGAVMVVVNGNVNLREQYRDYQVNTSY